MRKRNLFLQFFGVHTAIIFVAVVLVSLFTWLEGSRIFKAQWLDELDVQADMAVAIFEGANARLDIKADCQEFFNRLEKLDIHRFTLVLTDGSVIGDTRAPVSEMDSHAKRPEIVQASISGKAHSERYSTTLNRKMVYVARRIPSDLTKPQQAILRVAVPVTTMANRISAIRHEFLFMAAIVLLAALLMSYVGALRIVGPVSDLQTGLTRIGNGDYAFRLVVPPVPHLAELARSINYAAGQLESHIHQLEEERNLRALILKCMEVGLIAVDSELRIININQSALRIFKVNAQNAVGCNIAEIIRYPDVLEVLDESRRSATKLEKTVTVADADAGGGDKILVLQANALEGLQNKRIGTLLVLSDITRLRKLETVRQDFVDNVSHELRTPVTSIKGFSETLLDGALDDSKTARHFVGIIARQSEQLEQIIHDLIELSRFDRNIDNELERNPIPLAEIVRNALEMCQARIEETGVDVKVDCPDDLVVKVHAGLIEQALVNLIDNALKYGCGGQKRIGVCAVKESLSVRVKVWDHGAGIEKRHLDRLFERFYRVDSGRSRELGGTGLGLAIVKHIVLLHQGTVQAESEPGRGACFTITLPEHL